MNMIKIMKKPLTYDDIPKMYLFCNHTKCPRRNKCLRFQAAMIVPLSVPHYEAININHVAGNEKECSYFSAYTHDLCTWHQPYIRRRSAQKSYGHTK